MGYEYAGQQSETSAPGNVSGGGYAASERSFPNSARLDALKSGAMRPTAADKGRRLDLREAMRAKMEQSFGADLSSVKMYESQAVADAGAEAVAQGNEIAFAPGKTDFSSQSGQALLGHELSHVVSQSRGEVTGGGFLSDSGLEARADREGAMAARGETIYSGEMNGGAVAPLSTASAAPMAGPMQAKKTPEQIAEKERKKAEKQKKKAEKARKKAEKKKGKNGAGQPAPLQQERINLIENDEPIPQAEPPKPVQEAPRPRLPDQEFQRFEYVPRLDPMAAGQNPRNIEIKDLQPFMMSDHRTGAFDKLSPATKREGKDKLAERLMATINADEYTTPIGKSSVDLHNTDKSVKMRGMMGMRQFRDLIGSHTQDMSDDEIIDLFKDIYAPTRKGLDTEDKKKEADAQFDRGMYKLKEIYYKHLKRMEATYGTLPSQMHPEDFLKIAGPEFKEHNINQDWGIFTTHGGKYIDKNDEKDQEFLRLADYYQKAALKHTAYQATEMMERISGQNSKYEEEVIEPEVDKITPEMEAAIGGPKMNEEQLEAYNKDLSKRAKEGGWTHKLFGRHK